MSEIHHPIRDAILVVYGKLSPEKPGPAFMGRFEPARIWPVIFYGDSVEDVVLKAERLRADTIERNEQSYINKVRAAEQARAAKKKERRK